jgi:hypothetical protein
MNFSTQHCEIPEGGETEMIAACGAEGTSPANGDHCFTNMLVKALKHFAASPDMFSALDPHQHITAQGVLLRGKNRINGCYRGDAVTPVFLRVNGHSNEPNIRLRSFNFKKDGSGCLWKHHSDSGIQIKGKPWPTNNATNKGNQPQENDASGISWNSQPGG